MDTCSNKSQLLREAIQASDRLSVHEMEQKEKGFWRDFGDKTTAYEQTFGYFVDQLECENFEILLFKLKEQNPDVPLAVLDLAAPVASFLSQYNMIDCGISATLADLRTKKQRVQDSERGLYSVEGNLLRRRTWRDLRALMHKHNVEGFGLIVCRPFAGILDDECYAQFYISLLWRTYDLLSEGGILMTEVPHFDGIEREIEQLTTYCEEQKIAISVQPPAEADEREYGHRYALMLRKS